MTYDLNHHAPLQFKFGRRQQNDIFATFTESNDKVCWERGCVIHVYILVKYPNMLLLYSQTKMLLCLKMLLNMRTLSKGRYRIFSTTKTVYFVTKVQQLEAVNYSHKYLHLKCGRGPNFIFHWGMYICHVYSTGLEIILINESSLRTKISRVLSCLDQEFRLDLENLFLIYIAL